MPIIDDGRKTILDHYDYIDPDEFKEEIEDMCDCDYEDVSEDERWRCVYQIEESHYEAEKEMIQAEIGDCQVLCVGYVQLWTGNAPGGFIVDNFQEAIWKMVGNDMGDIGLYQDADDELHMTFTHHDGTDDVVVRKITREGRGFVNDNYYDYDDPMSDREVHKKLMEDEALSQKITLI